MRLRALQIENWSFLTPQLIDIFKLFTRRFPVGFLSFLLTFRKARLGRTSLLKMLRTLRLKSDYFNLEDLFYFIFISLFLHRPPPPSALMGNVVLLNVGRENEN